MKHSDDNLSAIRHSIAHLLAAAVRELYPGAQNTIGPAIENGFYQDFAMPEPISEDNLPKIEKKMRELLKGWREFEGKEVTSAEARKEFSWNPFKVEMIDELADKGEKITFYTCGGFIDLCRGGHVQSGSEIKPDTFKLTRVSGAYWRGDQNKQQLQRVYGVAFADVDDLQKHISMLEEAKKRDHRRLGKELDLFIFSDMVGSGLPLFTPKGTVLREQLTAFSNSLREKAGFQKVWVPHITKKDLYEASGHWAKFGDELFLVRSQETSDELVMKPMNCPHHTRIYASQPRSYRDLPIRYLETTTVYRDEKSGELGGLSRVRSITQDDSHAFCRHDQLEKEISNMLEAAHELYATLDMKLRVRLSYRDDSDGYLGDKKLWDSAQKQLKNAVVAAKLDYFEEKGEAAFYGPKIDFMATDAIGREHQVATVQLDFVQSERFGLEYVAEGGGIERPVMVHVALLGSIERFLSVYIEHSYGRFPVWLAPEQIRLLTVNQEKATTEFAKKVEQQAKELGLRMGVDNSNESVGKKIRTAELIKTPYVVVVGDKEIETGKVVPRIRGDMEVQKPDQAYSIESFLKTVANEAKTRVNKSSL